MEKFGVYVTKVMDNIDKWSTWNFWLANIYVMMALTPPHNNGDAILLILAMVLYYIWAKMELKIA